jgi:HSP20 family protein
MNTQSGTENFLTAFQRPGASLFFPVQRELDRIFDQMSRGMSGASLAAASPCMDVTETKTGLEFAFELPGMTQSDVRITVEDDVLTVSGEKRTEKESKDRHRRVVERSFGAFERSVTLPANVDAAKIKATMADGVLRVTAPKHAGAEPKTIEIQSAK